ncbi:MAG: NAD(P)-binding oxidoreductase [Candidatus Sulfotelmatobacter sp.]
MNLLIVGANGKTGGALVQLACELGHSVTALMHHEPPQPMTCSRIILGDVRDSQLLESAMAGQHAVIDTIGTRKPFLKTTLETDTARLLIAAMHRHSIRRIVAVSSIGVGDSIVNVPRLYRALMPIFFRGAIPDKEGMEAQLRQSNLDWTIVRPAGLTDGRGTDSVQIITPASRHHVCSIARRDVAAFILNHLTDAEVYQKIVGIAAQ